MYGYFIILFKDCLVIYYLSEWILLFNLVIYIYIYIHIVYVCIYIYI